MNNKKTAKVLLNVAKELIKEAAPELIKTDGFLYQHFDSRGGTVFVVADNRKRADEIHTLCFMGKSADKEDIDLFSKGLKYDFVGKVSIFSVKPLPHNKDLEDDLKGFVIAKGKNTEWPPQSDEDYYNPNSKELEFVAKGAKPIKFKKFQHPVWEDDAYSFIVLRK